MSPHYSIHGKIQTPITDDEFYKLMEKGHFTDVKHPGYVALIYYTAVRASEGRRTLKTQIRLDKKRLYFNVGERLKGSKETPELPIPLDLPFVDEIVYCWEEALEGGRIWGFCRKTGYNIMRRVYAYPHFYRLSRITNFFLEGWTIPQVRAWTGLNVKTLDAYIGMVDVTKMGDALR